MVFTASECARAREDFPALDRTIEGHPIAFLDGPGGTQVPQLVLDAIRESYIYRNANFDGAFATSAAVGSAVREAREIAAAFLGANSAREISFGANMTSLNFALSHALLRSMKAGDEVVITALDHEANRGPWLKLEALGIIVREVALGRDGLLDREDLVAKVNERTQVVAIGMASNSLGTVSDLALARSLCDKFNAKLVVDAVHYAAHFPLDVSALDVDFLLCSAYKFYGPHIGILYARDGLLDQLDTDRLSTQKGVAPYRIETGTLNHAAIAGVSAAIKYIASFGHGSSLREQILDAMGAIHDYEVDLARYYFDRARQIDKISVWGPGFDDSPRAPTVSLTIDGVRAETIAAELGRTGIQVWHGHFYAQRVLDVLELNEYGGLMRVGISMYNQREEIDRLLDTLSLIASA